MTLFYHEFTMSFNSWTLFYMSFLPLKQWTEFTMTDVELYLMWTLWNYIIVNPEWHLNGCEMIYLMWTLWNYIIVNFTWILNDIWMDVKWFDWNFNKTVQRMNISSVIILLPSNPAQGNYCDTLWQFDQCPLVLWHYHCIGYMWACILNIWYHPI